MSDTVEWKKVYVIVEGEPSEVEDEGVPGIYEIEVDPELDEGQSSEAALDVFHDHVGIEMLDDFDISVVNEDGVALPRLDKYESGSLSMHAEYLGQTPNDPRRPASAITPSP